MSEITEYLNRHLEDQKMAADLIDKEVGLKVMHQYLTTEECCIFVNALNRSFQLKIYDPDWIHEKDVIERLKQLIEIRKNKEIV